MIDLASSRLYKTIILSITTLFLTVQVGLAERIDKSFAETIAQNYLTHLGASAINHSIESIEERSSSNQVVGYLVNLSPQGYILVAADTIRVPVKAYSLSTTFSALPSPWQEVLLSELYIPQIASAKSSTTVETTNNTYWDFLTEPQALAKSMSYTPDTYLLTTKWNQGPPYNDFNPEINGEKTVTGCTQTAVAQVMNYHQHPQTGAGVYTHSWNGQTLTAIMNRPFNWAIMGDTPHTSEDSWEREEVAALMLDLGILNQAIFGTCDTGTAAGFWIYQFREAFGYAPIYSMNYSANNPSESFFETIKDEIDNLRPVLLSIPDHMTVADGYASDGAGRKIHVNMGWGGADDDYYFLDQTIVTGTYSFPPYHTIYYNIKPCAGAECLTPPSPAGNNQAPVFVHPLPDIAVNSDHIVRIDARDPDGDDVELEVYSSCTPEALPVSDNLLTLPHGATDSYCQYTVIANSQDGRAASSFKVLSETTDVYKGESFVITGNWDNNSEVDEYQVFLAGQTDISGSRGNLDQAYFYIGIKDQGGQTVVSDTDQPISQEFTPGIYTITASLSSRWSYYFYEEDYSDYIISISMDSSLDEIASYSGLILEECQLMVSLSGDGAGAITSFPESIDCGQSCTEMFTCNSYVELTAHADDFSLFSGWSGDCTGSENNLTHRVQDPSNCTATFLADGDQDNMPDSWETQYGLDTTRDDSNEDNDEDGTSNIEEYQNGTPPVLLKGDINGDDSVDLADVIMTLQIITGQAPTGVRKAADVNGDGQINTAEALYCLKQIYNSP